MVILKSKNRNVNTIKIHFLKKMWILIPNKTSGEKSYKYFIGYLDDDCKIYLLHTVLPKMGTYIKSYDCKTKWMYFLIEDDENYDGIWEKKVSTGIKKTLIMNLSKIKISEN